MTTTGVIKTFSQITPSTADMTASDYVLGVKGGTADVLFTYSQIRAGVYILTLQAITTSNDTIVQATDLAYVNRVGPTTTGITLPDASGRVNRPLRVVDYSTSVVGHTITLTPYLAAQTVMRQSTWELFSNSASLASVMLVPVTDPDNSSNYVWMIAP